MNCQHHASYGKYSTETILPIINLLISMDNVVPLYKYMSLVLTFHNKLYEVRG